MSLKLIINDSFTVILICSHITTTLTSNIVICSSVMPDVIICVQYDLDKGQIFMKEHILKILLLSEIPLMEVCTN